MRPNDIWQARVDLAAALRWAHRLGWQTAVCNHFSMMVPGSDELFLIFGDQTNGEVTYGGGRFLYAAPPDKQGRVVVDFNKAYNPPCVFTPYATCPLPPLQNRLSVRVEAGEKTYGHH